MPFASAKQEYYMMINETSTWKRWVKKYGHASGWEKYKKSRAKKAAKTRKRKKNK